MALPDGKIQADFTEKPIASKQRADGAQKLDVDISGSSAPAGIATEAKQDVGNASLAAILAGMATAVLQAASNVLIAAGNAILTNINANMATAANQNPPVTTPAVYNITLTNADTEYSQALPANTRQYRWRCRTAYAVRFQYVTGKVATPTAPYETLPSNMDYMSDDNNFTGMTLYFASAQAGVVVELECFT